jgi:hypothetical protein
MSKKRKPPLPSSTEKVQTLNPLIEMPISYYKGIGRVVQAHALLETGVAQLMFAILKIQEPEGRVAFEYRAASTMFTMARRPLELHGLTPKVDVVALEEQIKELCDARDQLAHCLWVERDGEIAIRLTQGTYETLEGKRSRPILPEGKRLPSNYFGDTRELILETAKIVNSLREDVEAALRT